MDDYWQQSGTCHNQRAVRSKLNMSSRLKPTAAADAYEGRLCECGNEQARDVTAPSSGHELIRPQLHLCIPLNKRVPWMYADAVCRQLWP